MNRTQVFDSVLQAIGNTPIVRLNRVNGQSPANLYAKLEFMNPGGSIKDRIGGWLIDDAEKKGLLKPGGTLVEGTSGNTGVGLAIAAAIKGYKCVFTLPDKMSQEKIKNLRAFGAKVIVTPTAVEPEDPRSYYQVARRMAREIPNAIYVDQYNNLANRECHYQTTGPEILKQMPDIDVFIAGIGTGGTICGVGRYLKEHKPSVEVVAVDPVGSIVHEYFKTGKMLSMPKTYKIEGIGEDFIPRNYDFSVINDMIQVSDKPAFVMTRNLLTQEGLYAGVSSGAAMQGALDWVQSQGERMRGKNVLIVFPDSGNRYLSKAFDDDWMREAGLLDETSIGTIRDVLSSVRPTGGSVISVKGTDRVSNVIDLLREKGISQVPVMDDQGWPRGVLTESMLLAALYEGRATGSETVLSLSSPSIEFVRLDDSVEKAMKLLGQNKTLLVQKDGSTREILEILTKIDLLSFLGGRG